MSERDDIQSLKLSPEERAAAAAVASLPVPPARDAFQARLRASFVAGTIEAPAPPRVVRGRMSWIAPLAAAAVLLAMLTLRGEPPLRWDVVSVDAAHVLVDGREVAGAELGETLAAHVRTVRIPDGGRVELLGDGMLFLQLNGGVEVDLPRRLGDGFVSRVGGAGTLRVATGPRFAGSRYLVRTDAAELEVTGTVFTVIKSHGDACICVLEGKVRACAPGDQSMESIEAGNRMTFHDFGRDVGRGSMLPGERDELSRIHARHAELFSQH